MEEFSRGKVYKIYAEKGLYNNLNCYINLNAHKVEMLSMSSLF